MSTVVTVSLRTTDGQYAIRWLQKSSGSALLAACHSIRTTQTISRKQEGSEKAESPRREREEIG